MRKDSGWLGNGDVRRSDKFCKGKKPKDGSVKKIDGYLPQIFIEALDGENFSFANPINLVTCNENDIIMVMDGASSGRVEIGFNGIIGSTLAKIICKNENINQFYLYFVLLNRQQKIRENTTDSAQLELGDIKYAKKTIEKIIEFIKSLKSQ